MRLYQPHDISGRNAHGFEDVTISGGGRETVRLQGYRAQRFGITGLFASVASGSADDLRFTLTVEEKNSVRTEFRDMPGFVVLPLFANGFLLQAPLLVGRGQSYLLTVRNPSGSSVDLSLHVAGLTAEQLRQRHDAIRAFLGDVPRIRFAFATETVASNGVERIRLTVPSGDWVMDRPVVGVSADPDEHTWALANDDGRLLQDAYVGVFREYILESTLPTPVAIQRSGDIVAEVENLSAAQTTAGFLAVLYERLEGMPYDDSTD